MSFRRFMSLHICASSNGKIICLCSQQLWFTVLPIDNAHLCIIQAVKTLSVHPLLYTLSYYQYLQSYKQN